VKGNLLQVRTLKTYLIVVPLLIAAHVASACAEIRVEGSASSVHVDARDATVAEILAALGERFALHYRGTTGSRSLTATFEGPLRHVVARALDGYNYVIRERTDGLEVIVLSTTSPYAVPAPAFAPPTVPSRRQRED
jgi:hypothetical protein